MRKYEKNLKFFEKKIGFGKKKFWLQYPHQNWTLVLVSDTETWVGATANPLKSEDGNGQLTRVAFKINDFL